MYIENVGLIYFDSVFTEKLGRFFEKDKRACIDMLSCLANKHKSPISYVCY